MRPNVSESNASLTEIEIKIYDTKLQLRASKSPFITKAVRLLALEFSRFLIHYNRRRLTLAAILPPKFRSLALQFGGRWKASIRVPGNDANRGISGIAALCYSLPASLRSRQRKMVVFDVLPC
jgi:hypothetical protein